MYGHYYYHYYLALRPSESLGLLNYGSHSALPTAVCRHILTFIYPTSFSTNSSHLYLGLPFLLLPSDLVSNIFLTDLP